MFAQALEETRNFAIEDGKMTGRISPAPLHIYPSLERGYLLNTLAGLSGSTPYLTGNTVNMFMIDKDITKINKKYTAGGDSPGD